MISEVYIYDALTGALLSPLPALAEVEIEQLADEELEPETDPCAQNPALTKGPTTEP